MESHGQLRPLSFLAQIDCARLPDTEARGRLPESGTLYFFIDWGIVDSEYDEGTLFANVVHYHPGSTDGMVEAVPPDSLPACYDDNAEYQYPWLKHTDRSDRGYPRLFPKWAFEPFVVRVFADEHAFEQAGNSADRYQELWLEEQLKAFGEVVGPPVPWNAFRVSDEHEGPWRHYPGFPESWISVEIFAGLLCEKMSEVIQNPRRMQRTLPDGTSWPIDPDQIMIAYEEARKQAQSWVERSRNEGLFNPVTEPQRQEFWHWCSQLDESRGCTPIDRIYDRRGTYTLNQCLSEAMRRGPDYCLSHSAEAAALVPDGLREDLRWKHSVVTSGFGSGIVRHQMLGAGTSVQGAPERFRGTHLLLMQFASDPGMDWMWGDVGVLQYWITPKDLQALRFDRIAVTVEGH